MAMVLISLTKTHYNWHCSHPFFCEDNYLEDNSFIYNLSMKQKVSFLFLKK